MKKQPEITARTQENITEAFWILYCQKRIEQIPIKEVTDKAGYHRSTFYEYYVDIYDVLEQLEDALLERLKEHVMQSIEAGLQDDPIQNLANFYEAESKYLSVLLGGNGDPGFARKIKAVMRPALVKAFKLSEREVHTTYILEFALSGLIAAITQWYQNNKNLPAQEMIFLLRSMLMNGAYPVIQEYAAAG